MNDEEWSALEATESIPQHVDGRTVEEDLKAHAELIANAERLTSPSSIEAARSISARIEAFARLDVEELCRLDLEKLSFDAQRGDLAQVIRFAGEIDRAALMFAAPGTLKGLKQSADEFGKLVKRIESFIVDQRVSSPVPAGEQQRLAGDIVRICAEFSNHAQGIVAYTTARVLSRGAPLATQLVQTANEVKEILSRAEKANASITAMEEASKTATRKIGTSATQGHFYAQAAEHAKYSKIWLGVTTVALFGAATLTGALYDDAVKRATGATTLTTMQFIQLSIIRVLAVSLAASVGVWCARIYRAHRHNYVVNKQRVNALATFESFVVSAKDDATKSAVLLQAVSSIFALQQTGYDSGDGDAGGVPRLVEVIKPVIESSGGRSA